MKLSKKILSLVLALAMVFGVMSPVLIPASAEGETYTVTVAASPAEGGTVTGGGSFEYGSMPNRIPAGTSFTGFQGTAPLLKSSFFPS